MNSNSGFSEPSLCSPEDVTEQVRAIVAESSGMSIEQLQAGSLLRELPWDSLDYVECVMELEEHFDISIPEDFLEGANTVDDVVDGIRKLLVEKESKAT
mgnify:CR=1 FL=1